MPSSYGSQKRWALRSFDDVFVHFGLGQRSSGGDANLKRGEPVKLIYIAGPYTAASRVEVEGNIWLATVAAADITRLGAMAVCPHLLTPPVVARAGTDELWYRATLELSRRCDALYMLPRWRDSCGAMREREAAIAEGRPVFHVLAELSAWLDEQKASNG
jgi:hypothetical protein